MKKYINSDLAIEKTGILNSNIKDSSEYCEVKKDNCTICRLDISSKELSLKYGRKEGHYVTVFFEELTLMDKKNFDMLTATVAAEIKEVISLACEKNIRDCSVLAVGLGNPSLSVDAIGPLAIEKLIITRHIGFDYEIGCSVAAITPGVLSNTGIETAELVKAASEHIKPDVIIVIDALAAARCESLGTTVQISDSGIMPGSGVGNARKAINKENMRLPVISIGIPTVVSSSTLIIDALEKAGISEISDELVEVLRDGKSFFVSPRECDVIVERAANLVATAINVALGTYS